MGIFSNNARRYWDRNIPVMPLRINDKRPQLDAWQVFSDRMPTAEEQSKWLDLFDRGNIGLPLGPASGLVALDIDTDDPEIIRTIEMVMPASPWRRVGRRGFVMMYRWNEHRNRDLKDGNGKTIVQILSKGRQVVLPPSIHPDTMQPYVANCELLDVVATLPMLPTDAMAMIEGALRDAGYDMRAGGTDTKISIFVPAGARDNAMVAHAGILSRAILRGERTLLQALEEIAEWVASFVEKVAGDDITPERAQEKVVEFLKRDVTGAKRRSLPMGWDDGLSVEDRDKMGLGFTDENIQWDFQKVVDFLQREFEHHVDNKSHGFRQAVETALDRIARSPGIPELDVDRVLKFINEVSQGAFSVVSLRKHLNTLRAGEITGTNHTEIAEAVFQDLSEFGAVRNYAGKFWQWKGACWEVLDGATILGHISDNYSTLPAARKANDHQGIVKVMSTLKEVNQPLERVPVYGVNFANGFLDEDLVLRPHNPDYGCTYVLPYRYLPERAGLCPRFFQLLSDAWGKDPDFTDKILALQEALATTLIGRAPRYSRAICLFGVAASGKTTLMDILRGLMPSTAISTIPPTDWGDKYLPADLFGSLLNVCGELSESKPIQGESFKMIVEGSTITAQRKHGQPFQFQPRCAQWFATNHLPKTRDTSDGFNRRWLFLHFPHTFKGEKVANFAELVIAEEREEIAAWAIQGFTRLKENKDYTLPTSHMALIDEMANDNNSVRYFLAQCPRLRVGRAEHEGLKNSEIRTTATKLHEEYWSFCIGVGLASRVGLPSFRKRMQELEQVFNFRHILEPTHQGQVQSVYEYITLAAGLK